MRENPDSPTSQRSTRWLALLIFFVAGLVLFLLSNRWVNIFDEGIALTNAMRIAAGQAIHRNFYYEYGPGNIYLLAGLFKIFGESVLLERILWIVEAASMAAVVFILLDRFAGRRVALGAVIGCLLWPSALSWLTLPMVLSAWVIGKDFERELSNKTAFYAGLLGGTTFLFRYDVGGTVAVAQILLLFAAAFLRRGNIKPAVREAAEKSGFYLGGFAVIAVPLLVWYAADGILPAMIYDIFNPAKYYYAGRNLPFPHIHRQNFEDIVVYVLPVLIVASLFLVIRFWLQWRRAKTSPVAIPRWIGPVLSFAVIAAIAYLKAIVRIGAGPLFLCASACIVLGAVLFASRQAFDSVSKAVIGAMLVLFALAGAAGEWHDMHMERGRGASMIGWILTRSHQAPYPPFRSWCGDRNPLSKGLCFFNDNDHIQAIEYLEARTTPADTLYVGLPHHDRIFASDNVTYFATQRLPAVNWTQFDPFLENRADIQAQMIEEMEKNQPPYAVLDSEFEGAHEPNGSSVSTGVHLLDDYIAAHYTFDVRFGELTILKRKD